MAYDKSYYERNKAACLKRSYSWRDKNRKRVNECARKSHRKQKLEHPEKSMYESAKRRAKDRGLEFNIEVSDIIIPEYCPALGIKLEFGHGKVQASSPTLDRIDNSKGYIRGNIVVVSKKANTAKSDTSIEELRKILDFYTKLITG